MFFRKLEWDRPMEYDDNKSISSYKPIINSALTAFKNWQQLVTILLEKF